MNRSVKALNLILPNNLRDIIDTLAFFLDYIPLNNQFLTHFFHQLQQENLVKNKDSFIQFLELTNFLRRHGLITYDTKLTYGKVHPILGYQLRVQKQQNKSGELLRAFIKSYNQYANILNKLLETRTPKKALEFSPLINNLFFLSFRSIRNQEPVEELYTLSKFILEQSRSEKTHFEFLQNLAGTYQQQTVSDFNNLLLIDFIGCLDELAALHRQRGNFQQSLSICLENLAIFQMKEPKQMNQVEKTAVATLLINLATTYREIRDYDHALTKGEQALELVQPLNQPVLLANVYIELGNLYKTTNQFEKSEAIYLQALALIDSDQARSATIKFNLGTIYDNLRQWSKSITYYEEALAFFQDEGNKRMEGLCFMNIGLVYENQGHFSKSKSYYKKAMHIFIPLENAFYEAQTYQNVAIVSMKERIYEDALTYFKKALFVYQRLDRPLLIAEIQQNMGEVYRLLKQYDSSIFYGKAALDAFTQNGDLISIAKINQNLGNTYYMIDELKLARASYIRAQEIYEAQGFHFQLGTIYQNLALIAQAFGQYLEGQTYLLEAVKLFIPYKDFRQIGWLVSNANRFAYTFNDKQVLKQLNELLEVHFTKDELQEIIQQAKVFYEQ